MPRKACYISGRMRGLPDLGFSLFDAAKKILQAKGWRCISPADMDRAMGFDVNDVGYDFDVEGAFRRDFQAILDVDAMVLLPNWKYSSGAHAELVVAYFIGIPVYLMDLEKEEITRVTVKMDGWANFRLVREEAA